jgi:hypothetical protein
MSDTAQDTQTVFYQLGRDQESGFEQITVFVKGKGQFPARSDHPNFEEIVAAARAGDESVIDLFDISVTAGTKFQSLTERVSAAHGTLYFDGAPLHNALAEQVMQFLNDGVEDWKPLVNFYEKLATNPQDESVEHLFKFIDVNRDKQTEAFTITDDGNFIAYKGVASDGNGGYKSTASGKAIVDGEVVVGYIPNAVGSVVEMPRNEVTFDPGKHCHSGLHVGTFAYAQSYGRGGAMLKVLINPRDVVSVPNDSAEKMRVCRYKVLEIIQAPTTTLVEPESKPEKKSFKSTVKKLLGSDGEVRVGDVYEDRDKRRQGRKVRVTAVNLNTATVVPYPATVGGKESKISTNRLNSRSYKRVRRGRKS